MGKTWLVENVLSLKFKFKATMLDIDLLQRLCQVPVKMELKQEDLLAMYRGKPAFLLPYNVAALCNHPLSS